MEQSVNITYYLEDLKRLQEIDLAILDALVDKYPASANLHFLRAKKYQLEGLLDDIAVFQNASFYVTDHHCLYQRMLHSELELELKENADEPIETMTNTSENLVPNQAKAIMDKTDSDVKDEGLTPFEKELISSIANLKLAEEASKDLVDSMDVSTTPDEIHLEGQETQSQKAGTEATEIDALKKENSKMEHPVGDKSSEVLSPFSTWLLSLKHPVVAIQSDEPTDAEAIVSAEKSNSDGLKKEKKRAKKKKKKKKRQIELEARAKRSVELSEDLATEALAELLASQGHFKEAKKMFKKLSLIFPEKSSYFAVRIQSIKKKKNDH